MVPCDYCSACFHLECLDPPLSHFPPRSDRWMCPLHAEHVVDRCLVRTIRLSERISMWDQLAIFNTADKRQPPNDLNGATHEIRMGTEDEASVLSELMRAVHRGRLEASNARNACLALAPSAALMHNDEHTPDRVIRVVVSDFQSLV